MLKNLLKSFLVITFLLTTAFAGNQKNSSNYQEELYKIKVELEKIKLTQHYENRDSKIEAIEKSIKSLESRLNKDFQKYDELIKRQDARIGDTGFYLTMLGVLITVIIIFFAFRYESIARNQADKEVKAWIDDKADEEFQPKVNEYLEQLKTKGESLLQEIKEEAEKLNNEHRDMMDDLSKPLSEDAKEKLDSDVKKYIDEFKKKLAK